MRCISGARRVSSCFASAPDVPGKTIIVYSKDECPLCDGLKDKISGILDRAPFSGSMLKDYSMEVRDILTNPSWEEKYSMQIPVMAVEQSDGREVIIPRTSPRVTADKLERHIVEFLKSNIL